MRDFTLAYEYADATISGISITLIRTFQVELPKKVQELLEERHRPQGPVAFINVQPVGIIYEVHPSLEKLFAKFNTNDYAWIKQNVVISVEE